MTGPAAESPTAQRSVLAGQAERLPLPDASVDLVHARTAYFFGPGCEPGLAEAERVLRPGGAIAIVDLDGSFAPYGDWMRADIPSYRPARVERFFARQGFTLRRVQTRWVFPDRAPIWRPCCASSSAPRSPRGRSLRRSGLTLPVGYRLHVRRKPTGPLLPGSAAKLRRA